MNYNYFVRSQIKSHKFLFAVGILQMSIVVYLIILLFSDFEDLSYATKLFEKMDSDNYIYITRTITGIFEKDEEESIIFEEYQKLRDDYIESGIDYHEASDKAWEELGNPDLDSRRINEDEISDMPYLKNVWYIDNTPVYHDIGNDEYQLIEAIDIEFAKVLNYNIKKGVWLTGAKSNGNTIDAVVANNTDYDLGDIISIDADEFDGSEYISIDTGYKLRIAGILDYGEAEPAFSSTCSNIDSMNLYDVIQSYEDNTFLVLKDDIAQCLKEGGYTTSDGEHSYVIAETTADEAEQSEVTDYLSKKRLAAVSLKRMYNNTVDYQRNIISDSIIPTLAASLFSGFVIISISIFQMQYMSKKYKVFYICGMEKGKEKYIQMLYTVRIAVTAIVLALGIYSISGAWRYFKVVVDLAEDGYSKKTIMSWYSISDYIKISPISLLMIFILSIVIVFLSTALCARSVKYGKDK